MCAPEDSASNAVRIRDVERGAQQKQKAKAKEEVSE
jgi:hypothetical protein